MSDRTKLTRRAGLALVAAGAATVLPQSRAFTSTVADRVTTANTEPDPNALLGIEGIGAAPTDEITVTNNANYAMEVTVSTSAFQIQSPSGPYQTTFTLAPGASQPVDFLPETANTDSVAFVGVLTDAGDTVGSIELSRSISIPVIAGTTYRIRSVHSGLYVTGDTPGGGGGPGGGSGAVYQEVWQGTDDQRWFLDTDGSAYTFEHVSSGALLSLEFCFGWGCDGDVTDVVTRSTTGGGPGNDQRWTYTQNADGSYRIESVDNGDVLDVEGESTDPGGNIITYPFKGQNPDVPNQFWTLEPV